MARSRDGDRYRGLLIVAIAALLLSAGPLQAKETCKKCEFVACIKDTIERNEAMIAGYDRLRISYDPLWIEGGKKIASVNFDTVGNKSQTYGSLSSDLRRFGADVEKMNDEIPAPPACHYPGALEVGTDPESCVTEGLAAAKSEMPCDELYKFVKEHEDFHVAACNARRGGARPRLWQHKVAGVAATKDVPYVVLTPGGLAREEIDAYKAQNTKLQALLEEAEKKCKYSFTGVTVDCRIPPVRMGQKIEGEVCGDPVEGAWTIRPTYFAEGPHIPPVPAANNKPFKTDCLPAGGRLASQRMQILRASPGGGWMCEFKEGDAPTVTIRWVRMPQCQGPREQTYTVTVKREESCSKDDAAPPQQPDEDGPRLPNS